MLGWIKHKLESRLQGKISITSDMQMSPPLWQRVEEELKNLLMKVKEESKKEGMETHSSIAHGQRSLAGYSPWGPAESDMT